jgi:hypothetical protein
MEITPQKRARNRWGYVLTNNQTTAVNFGNSVTASNFIGNGSALSAINGTNIQAATINSNKFDTGTSNQLALAGTVPAYVLTNNQTNAVNISNQLTATMFYGDGSHLTGIAGTNGGTVTSVALDATALGFTVAGSPITSSGTLTPLRQFERSQYSERQRQ